MLKDGPFGYPLDPSEIQPKPAKPAVEVSVPQNMVGDLPVNPASPQATGSFYNAQYTMSPRNDGPLTTTVEVARGLLNSETKLSRKAELIRDVIAASTLLTIAGVFVWKAKDSMDRPNPYQLPQPTVTPARPRATETPIYNSDNQRVK